MNKYESVIIINPDLNEDIVQDVIEKMKELIISFTEKNKESLVVEDLGKKRLAYQIRKCEFGRYFIFDCFYANSEDTSELERMYKVTEEIIKFIVVRKDVDDE